MSVAVRLASGNVLVRMDTLGQAKTIPPAKHSHHFVQITAAIAALAGLLFGFDTGVISGAILFITGALKLTPFMEELLVSAALIGAVCGCILSGRVTDLIGRKRTILITAAIFIVGSILSAVATSVGTLIIGRIAIGVAIGVASYTAPLYISEIAPPNLRGGLVTLNSACHYGGHPARLCRGRGVCWQRKLAMDVRVWRFAGHSPSMLGLLFCRRVHVGYCFTSRKQRLGMC